MQDIILQAVKALQQQQTILYPTDTIWGIGCDAFSPAAVEKIYAIKQRDHSKSMLILALPGQLPGLQQHLGTQYPQVWQLLHDARPTTVIFPNALQLLPHLAANLPAADNSIGIRIPQHPFCQALLEKFGQPIVSTSANFSGTPSPLSALDIDPKLKERIDYTVPNLPEWESHQDQSSRIVKVSDNGTLITIRP